MLCQRFDQLISMETTFLRSRISDGNSLMIMTGYLSPTASSTATSKMTRTMLLFVILAMTLTGRQCKESDPLKGYDFRVSAMPVRGFLYITKDGDNVTLTGIVKDFYDVLFDQSAGFRYHWVLVNLSVAAVRGFTQASIDILLDGEVDISSLGFVPTPQRLRYMDFTRPVLVEPYTFLIPYPEAKSPLWGPVRPFQPTVWLVFFIAFLSTIAALSMLSMDKTKSMFTVVSDNTLYIITILIYNGEYYRIGVLHVRILLAIWSLMCVILINAYTGNLTSYLTFPALETVPNSFEELAKMNDYSLIIDYKSVLAEQILEAKSGPMKVLGDSLRKYPSHLFRSSKESYALRQEMKTAYPGVAYINWYNLVVYNPGGQCRYTVSKQLSYALYSSPAVTKHSPYLEALDARLLRINEMGLMNHLKKKHMPRIAKCLLGSREKSKMVKLNLEAFLSAFFILACGVGLSVATFIAELLAKARSPLKMTQ